MATIFGCPPSLSHPLARTYSFSTSSKPSPPPSHSPSQPQSSDQYPQLGTTSSSSDQQEPVKVEKKKPSPRAAESTDWVASSLTRRFGLGAGLAWAGFLAFGVVSEQIKTRLEVSQQEANTKDVEKQEEVVLPNGIRQTHRYCDLKVGGGASPRTGDLVVIDLKGTVEGTGQVFVDTFGGGNKRPLALVMGSRPYSKGMCEGVEYALRSMRAGGKRRVIVPPSLGFGEDGAELGSGVQIPALASLEYIVEVDKVSIAPA